MAEEEKEKKVKRDRSVSGELDRSEAVQGAKKELGKLSSKELSELATTLERVRRIFPQVDEYLTPIELLDALDIGDLAACPYCLSCNSCQSCFTCQTCNSCETCQTCNTCQQEVGALCAAGDVFARPFDPQIVVRRQLVELVNRLSSIV